LGQDGESVLGLTDEACGEVSSMAEASVAIQQAFLWLSMRGYVQLGSDGAGEHMVVLKRPLQARER